MIKVLPIKKVEDIEKIKQKYREKELYYDLLLFLLTINTGVKPTALFNLNVKQLKYKKYLTVSKGITYNLNDEIIELISIVCKGKKSSELVFSRETTENVVRYGYYVNFKDVCAELNIYNASIDSLRRTFGYHHYLAHKDLFFLQWYFNQNTAEQTLNYIDIHEPMSAGFREGLNF